MNKHLLLACILLFASLVFADGGCKRRDGGNCDNSGSGGGDDDDHRDVSYENGGDYVKIESKNGTDKLEFEIGTSEWFDIRLKYYTSTDATEEEAKYKIRFRSVIEYADSGAANGYQPGESVQITDFSQVTWDPIFCNTTTSSIDCYVRTNGAYAGLFGSSIHVGGSTFSQDGVIVKPNSAKINVVLNKDRPNGNKLALDVRIVSETERESRDESDDSRDGTAVNPEAQVSFSNDAYFSWAKVATVNGVEVNVISSTLAASDDSTDVDGDRRRDGGGCNKDHGGCDNSGSSGESSSKIIFSFDVGTPGAIVWDPKIGYSASNMLIPSLMLLAMLLAFL